MPMNDLCIIIFLLQESLNVVKTFIEIIIEIKKALNSAKLK